MSIKRYRNDNPRTASEVASSIETELQSVNPNAPVVVGTQNYAFIQSFATTIAEQQEQGLADLYDASFLTDSTGEELTKNAAEVGVSRNSATAATGVVTFSRETSASQDYLIPAGTTVSTGGDNPITYDTTEQTTISSGTSSADANIVANEAGSSGNVGADTVVVLVEKPTGVDSVTNSNPVGDPNYTLTDGSTKQRLGQERETDPELRERALSARAIGGAGTADATELALENIDEVVSADVFTNRTSSSQNGVSAWHTEVRVYGGDVENIANALYETLPIATIKSLEGGVNGSLASFTITGSDLYGDVTIPITRPVVVTLDITIDVVHDSSYSGADEVKDAIVGYIGGTESDGSSITGIGQGQSVLVNEVENVSEDVGGVEYANVTLVDQNDDGSDDTTTDSDGVPVLSVGDNEVAQVDASNITVNETAR